MEDQVENSVKNRRERGESGEICRWNRASVAGERKQNKAIRRCSGSKRADGDEIESDESDERTISWMSTHEVSQQN